MSLADYAADVLANVNTAAAAASITLPELQYVAPGPFSSVSFDCEQVTVTVDAVTRGAPGEPVAAYTRAAEASATITVCVVKMCMPTSEDEAPPLADDQAAAAAVTLPLLDMLWRNAATILAAGGCKHHGLVTAKLLDVQGEAGGALLTGTVDLLDL